MWTGGSGRTAPQSSKPHALSPSRSTSRGDVSNHTGPVADAGARQHAPLGAAASHAGLPGHREPHLWRRGCVRTAGGGWCKVWLRAVATAARWGFVANKCAYGGRGLNPFGRAEALPPAGEAPDRDRDLPGESNAGATEGELSEDGHIAQRAAGPRRVRTVPRRSVPAMARSAVDAVAD